MILTGPAIPCRHRARRHHHHAPDRQRLIPIDQTGVTLHLHPTVLGRGADHGDPPVGSLTSASSSSHRPRRRDSLRHRHTRRHWPRGSTVMPPRLLPSYAATATHARRLRATRCLDGAVLDLFRHASRSWDGGEAAGPVRGRRGGVGGGVVLTDLRKTPSVVRWQSRRRACRGSARRRGPLRRALAGSLAVLLRRPHEANRTYHSETVNDLDGLLCNAWRSIQRAPRPRRTQLLMAAARGGHARADTSRSCAGGGAATLSTSWRTRTGTTPRWRAGGSRGSRLWIGSGWCSGEGGWVVGADGGSSARAGRRRATPQRWQGRVRPQMREPGVAATPSPQRRRAGGVAHVADVREPGVQRDNASLGNDGKGVHVRGDALSRSVA